MTYVVLCNGSVEYAGNDLDAARNVAVEIYAAIQVWADGKQFGVYEVRTALQELREFAW